MRSHFPIAVLLPVVFLALFTQAAHANGLNFNQNWFITGDYAVAGVGLKNTGGQGTITMNNVPCINGAGPLSFVGACTSGTTPVYPIAAFLYWETVENTPGAVGAKGVFDGNAITGQLLGSDSSSACWVSAKSQTLRVYRADVLRFLPVDPTTKLRLANYAHTVKLGSSVTGVPAAEVLATEGASLVVIYRIAAPGNPFIAPFRSVVIHDGEFTMSKLQPQMNLNIYGFYQASSTNPAATMTHIVGNGQSTFRESLEVGGAVPAHVSSNEPFVGAQGANWDNLTFGYNLAANASSTQTTVTLNGNAPDCLSWAAVVMSTNVQASDNDGLVDAWKLRGIHRNTQVSPATFGGCTDYPQDPCEDLHAMGATHGVKDIFIQMDWMHGYGDGTGGIDGTGKHSHIPQLAALTMVANAFAANHIALHFDVGNNYQGLGLPYIIPYQTTGNKPELLARGGSDLDESTLVCHGTCDYYEPYPVLSFKFGLASVRDGNSLLTPPTHALFAQDRKDAFHYVLFAHAVGGPYNLAGKALNANPLSISGIGDRPGGDFMVTLGLWRSAIPANDQVGSVLVQAGTLMHELGHNLDLSHGGWSSTPNCKPNYQSVMSYLYQTRGLTDVNGVEQIDYSHGFLLLLPLSESLLWTGPLGPLPYRMRYYGPLNASNSPGQAAQVHCDGTPIIGGVSEIRLEGSGLFTPDWSNGTLTPLGKLFAFDANYDGIPGEILTDSPDWSSLNLAQIGSRVNFGSLSTGSSATDAGSAATDAGSAATDAGSAATDAGSAATDAGSAATDAGSAATDAGDEDYDSHIRTSTDGIPTPQQCSGCGLKVTNVASANTHAWTPPPTGGGLTYDIYRCVGGGCTPSAALTKGWVPPSPSAPTFTDAVTDTLHAGATCASTSTCYNTTYTYSVTAVPSGGSESGYSNTASSEVTHLFVIADNQAVVYGSANPTPTFKIYGDVAGSLSSALVSCFYGTTPPPAPPLVPRNAGNYTITCTGPASTSATDFVTYNAPYLTYTPGTLTISQRPITVTAASSKIYDANTTCPIPTCTAGPVVTWAGSGPALAYTDTPNFSESFDNKNVGATHKVTPAGTVNDGGTPVGSNYSYTFVSINTGTITPATLTITASTNTKYYDGTTSAAATPTTSVVCDGSTVNGPPALCGTDTVTNLTETYNSPNFGNSVPITVSPGYVISDGNGGQNYTVSTRGTTGVINPAPVTATAGNYSGTYNGATQSPSACTVTPNRPNTTFIGTVTCMNNPALVGPNAGSGTVTPVPGYGSDSASNYAVMSVNGSWNIAKANAAITVTSYNVTYNGNPQTAMGTATGVGNVSLAAELNLSGTTHTNAGAYSTDPWTFTDITGNYNNASGTVSDTITQATPTVTDGGPTPAAPDYGQPVTLTVTVAPPQSGEVPTGTVTFSFTLNSITNYICSSGTISTTQCTVPLTFNGSNYVASVTTSNLPTAAENVMATYSGDPNFQGETANPVSVTVSKANSTVTLTKSTDPSAYGNALNLTVEVMDATGGSVGVPTGTVTLSFKLNPSDPNGQPYYICADGTVGTTACSMQNQITLAPDPMNPVGATATVPTSALPAGLASAIPPFSYPINATYSGDTNFAPSAPFGLSQTVNQAMPTVMVTGATCTFINGSPCVGSGTATGVLSPPDSLTPVTLTYTGTGNTVYSSQTAPTNAGTYTVTANFAGNANYAAGTSAPANITINAAAATVMFNVNSLSTTYNGSPQSPTVTTAPSGLAVTLAGAPQTNAGSYSVTASLNNPNYTASPAMGTFVISPLGITASITANNKNFDGTNAATIATCTPNVLPGDAGNVTCTASNATFSSFDPGSWPVTATTITLGGMAGSNYAPPSTATTTVNATISDTINLAALSFNGANYIPNTRSGPLQLTNNGTPSIAASSWLPTAIPVSSAFSTTFQFQISPPSSGIQSIADGFAFVIQGVSNTTYGIGGGSIGYAGIPNSIAFEFDTYYNSENNDPAPVALSLPYAAHIGIQSLGSGENSPNHSTAGLASPKLADFDDGSPHTATITYDGNSNLSVSLDTGVVVVTATLPDSKTLGTFLGLTDGSAYIGFTAGTGSNSETTKITSWTWD